MEQFIIKGPCHLKGDVKVSGSKNAALPIIAATALFREPLKLKNVPEIKDVFSIISILKELGAVANFKNNTLEIDPSGIKDIDPNPIKVRNLRASILIIAPLLIRNKKVSLPHPGGCLIGSRPVDVHIEAFIKMGAKFEQADEKYVLSADELEGMELSADFSVTGTENIVMAAVLSKGVTIIHLAAAEPHVQDLCNFLVTAGARIEGIGTHDLIITGVKELKGIDYEIIADQIEAGTFAIAAAATKGDVKIDGFIKDHHQSLLSKFDKTGVNYKILNDQTIEIKPSHQIKPFKIRTEIYPGFPTDLQAPMAVLATQANGTTEVYETIFEGRLGYVNELSKMGASCIIRDAHHASITGPSPLYGTRITSFDLRAGATLIIAGLIAQGESRLDQIEVIDRGYEKIEEKLKQLGANIRRVKLQEIE